MLIIFYSSLDLSNSVFVWIVGAAISCVIDGAINCAVAPVFPLFYSSLAVLVVGSSN